MENHADIFRGGIKDVSATVKSCQSYYEIARNLYFDGINLAPVTIEEKRKTIGILERANAVGAMFYDSYLLQGNLYRDLGKFHSAARAYKNAISVEPGRDGNDEIKKKARFLCLPMPARKCVSFLRKVVGKLNTWYGYA
jgi:tetratricopeptide (TPR) repeat protein